MPLAIHGLHYYLPEHQPLLIDNPKQFGLSEQEVKLYSRFYGLEKIPTYHGTTLNLLKEAALPLITRFNQQKIAWVIAPHTSPSLSPVGIALVRDLVTLLALEKAVPFAMTMNKCVSILRAMEISELLLIDAPKDSLVLIATGETVFTEQHRLLPNISITADAAAALLVSISDDHHEHQLLAMHHQTLGAYAGGAWMSLTRVAEFGKLFVATMFAVIERAIDKAGLQLSDIKLILPHNVNIPCWHHFANYVALPKKTIYLKNIGRTAHCFNSDLIINLGSALAEGLLCKGDYYLMATVGVGAMFGAAVFKY